MFEPLGVIVATTTAKNQTDTAAAFTIPTNQRVLIQADAACYILPVASGAVTAAAGALQGVLLDAGEKFEFTMGERLKSLSCVAVSGTVNVRVWRVH